MIKRSRLKTETFVRFARLDRAAADENARTIELSFSSEAPVGRWFGTEILDHAPGSVRMERLANAAPLLLGHESREQIGVVESARIDAAARQGRATVRFGRSARAEEIWRDVVDGIRRNVSVGYRVHEMVLEKQTEDEATYRATDWEPLEISIVAVPADISVGVGRAEGERVHDTIVKRRTTMKTDVKTAVVEAPGPTPPETTSARDVAERARADELARIREIDAIGRRFGLADEAKDAIERGATVAEFRQVALEKIAARAPKDLPAATTGEIGMTPREARAFSFLRAVRALVSKDWSHAPFEREVSAATEKKLNRVARGFLVPTDVLLAGAEKRDLTAGTGSAGGFLVGTTHMAGSFIELLRNRMLVRAMGATVMDGLVGNVDIPKQSGGATAYWVAENASVTESQQTFGQVLLSPKTVGAFTDISRRLMLQSTPAVEQLVRNDLATVLALAIDLAAINGSGTSNQPLGILNTSGIGDVAGGTNGAAPTWTHVVKLEEEVATDNADIGSLGYLTNAKVRSKLKQTEKASSTAIYVWGDRPAEPGFGDLNGYRAGVSNQVPSNLTKGSSSGVCSAILFGNWADLVIGEWGVMDVNVDTSSGSIAGTTRVVVLQDVDVAVRRAESFAAMKDALTA